MTTPGSPRITAVYAVHPPGPGGPNDWRTTLGQILVAVETDAGVRGIGVGGGGPVGVYLVHTILRPLLGGQPLHSIADIERLWERMYRDTLAYGRKGLAIMAISGVDLAPHDLTWIEEPLPPDDHEGYAALSKVSPVPIAGGEHEYTVHGFADLAKVKAHPIWQPDVCWTGGLTQLRAIYALAEREGTRVIPHRGAEVWSLHAIAALDPDPLAESGRPWMTWIEGQPLIVDGHITLLERPGFGVTPGAEVEALLVEARRDGHTNG